jgi:hypothetical protein
MSASIVTERPVGRARTAEDLVLQLKGLVHVRALLESHGVSPTEIAKHSDAIDRVRDELARLARAEAAGLARAR